MTEVKSACEALILEPKKKRLKEPKLKRGGNIKMYCQIIIYVDVDVIHLVLDRVQLWALLNMLMNPQIPKPSDASSSVLFSLSLCVSVSPSFVFLFYHYFSLLPLIPLFYPFYSPPSFHVWVICCVHIKPAGLKGPFQNKVLPVVTGICAKYGRNLRVLLRITVGKCEGAGLAQ